MEDMVVDGGGDGTERRTGEERGGATGAGLDRKEGEGRDGAGGGGGAEGGESPGRDGRAVAHTLAALMLAGSVEDGARRLEEGLRGLPFEVEVEYDAGYSIDGRVRFLIYCYARPGEEALGIQPMRELLTRISVPNAKIGYICNERPSNYRINVTPTSKMTAKEVVRQLVVNEAVQKHTESALGAPVDTLLVSAEKSSLDRDEREIPTTILTVSHPLVAYHLMLFSIRGLIRQEFPVHTSNLEPLPLLLEPGSSNPPSVGADLIRNKLEGVGLYLQLLRYPRDGGRNLGERRVLQHANALIEGCRKWKRETDELDGIGPVFASVYMVHDDDTIDVQIRSLIYRAAYKFVEYLQDPASADLLRVPPVGRHRLDYRSPSVLPTIYTGKEFFLHFGRGRRNMTYRRRDRRYGGYGGYRNDYRGPPPPPPPSSSSHHQQHHSHHQQHPPSSASSSQQQHQQQQHQQQQHQQHSSSQQHQQQQQQHHHHQRQQQQQEQQSQKQHYGQDERMPKRDRPDYDDDKMDVVKRSRIDMPLQSS